MLAVAALLTSTALGGSSYGKCETLLEGEYDIAGKVKAGVPAYHKSQIIDTCKATPGCGAVMRATKFWVEDLRKYGSYKELECPDDTDSKCAVYYMCLGSDMINSRGSLFMTVSSTGMTPELLRGIKKCKELTDNGCDACLADNDCQYNKQDSKCVYTQTADPKVPGSAWVFVASSCPADSTSGCWRFTDCTSCLDESDYKCVYDSSLGECVESETANMETGTVFYESSKCQVTSPSDNYVTASTSGKCLTQDGEDPKHSYFPDIGEDACEQKCNQDKQCFGYSVSSYGNCLNWLESGLKGGGEAWGGAGCNIKRAFYQRERSVRSVADVGGGITDDILARLGRLADALEDREARGQLGQSMAPEMMQAWVQAAFTPRTFAANGCYTLSLSQCCKKKDGRQGDYYGQNCAPASIGNKFTSYQNGRVVTGNVCEPECWIKGTCGTAKKFTSNIIRMNREEQRSCQFAG